MEDIAFSRAPPTGEKAEKFLFFASRSAIRLNDGQVRIAHARRNG
jgi:hypothetical protein